MSDIKPCPFPHCGNDKPFIVGGRNNRCVCCGSHKCQVTGPVCDSDELAVELWNAAPRRDDVPVAVAVDMDEVAKLRQEVAQLQRELEVSDTLHDKYVRAAIIGIMAHYGTKETPDYVIGEARDVANAAMKARKT